MKKFKDFVKGFTLDKNGYAVPNEPVHFRLIKKLGFTLDKNGYAVPNEPVHFKESTDDDLEKKLHEHQKHLHDGGSFRDDIYGKLSGYTTISGFLNNKLIADHKEGKPPCPKIKNTRDTLLKASTHTVGHEHTLYSGVNGWNPKEAAKSSKDGIVHMPAFTSASTDKNIAHGFSGKHVIAINMKPHDRAVHVGHKTSHTINEKESILPAGTKLKYKRTDYEHSPKHGVDFHVHHFEVHSQPESVEDYYEKYNK